MVAAASLISVSAWPVSSLSSTGALEARAKDKPKEGLILAIGDGKVLDSGERQKLTVKVGDRVLFSSYAGTEVKISGEEYLIMSENDVLAVIG